MLLPTGAPALTSINRQSPISPLQTKCCVDVMFNNGLPVSLKSGNLVYVTDTKLHVWFSSQGRDTAHLNYIMYQGKATSAETMDRSRFASRASSSPTKDNGSTFSCHHLNGVNKIFLQKLYLLV
jgi:hypothetical protein